MRAVGLCCHPYLLLYKEDNVKYKSVVVVLCVVMVEVQECSGM